MVFKNGQQKAQFIANPKMMAAIQIGQDEFEKFKRKYIMGEWEDTIDISHTVIDETKLLPEEKPMTEFLHNLIENAEEQK